VGLAPAQDRSVPRARADFLTPYRRELLALLDQRALARSGLRVAYDALHGAGAGVLDRVLREAGVSVRTRRTEPDPRFGNVAPDPHPEQLGMLCQEVRRMPGLRLGLATDGDADRYAVVDADGRALCETHVIALLVDYLARTNRVQRGVAISLATGSLVEHVAREHGLRVERHPIGFKHLASALREGRADCAGEESGGFALASFGLDKDGILAGCLLAELVATTGAPLRRRLGELFRRFGPSECGRLAVSADARAREALRAVASAPPERVAGAPVRGVLRRDGLRMRFDDGFVMLRASGTEPVLRIYAEAPGRRALERRLRAGARLLLGGRAGRAATRRP
jgi:phosphomannomutase